MLLTSPLLPPSYRQSRKCRFTDLWIRKLKPDPLKRVEFSDTEVGGIRGQLVLRVSPAGRKSFSYQYFSVGVTRNRRITIGEYPAVRLKKARDQARELAGQIASGRDPAAERAEEKAKTQQERSEVRTFDDVAELYLRDYAERQKRLEATSPPPKGGGFDLRLKSPKDLASDPGDSLEHLQQSARRPLRRVVEQPRR